MPILTLALVAALAVPAEPAPPHLYSGLALSPGGDRVAVLETDQRADATEEPHKLLLVRAAANGAVLATLDPCPACDYRNPAFSPDGQRLAFLGRDKKAGTTALFVYAGGKLVQRAVIKGVAQKPRFSPDGRSLALLEIVGAHKEAGATEAAAPQVGDIGESSDEQRIAVLSVDGQDDPRGVSPADTFVYEYDWTPDSAGFVVTAAKGDGDNNWWTAELDHVDLASGALRRIAAPSEQLDFPSVSPDGRSVAFIGGLMSDFGVVGGDVWLVPAAGGGPQSLTPGGVPRNLTPGFAGSFTSIQWRGRRIVATALVGASTAILSIDPATGAMRTLWSAPKTIRSGDGEVALDASGTRVAAVIEDYEHAPEVAAGPIATLGSTTITHANAAQVGAGIARSVTWTSDGRTVQGWLLAPRHVTPAKTYPMVVHVHGGPSSATTPTFSFNDARGSLNRRLLDAGYYQFFPNPRGSYGQGEAFTRANVRDFGGGDLADILAGVDAVEKIAPVDDRRLGVMGHSYGGFMTMWTVTHSHRFHAAVAGAGIANWISYYGQNGIDQWMIPFFGASAYDDPAIYRKLSPLESIKQATTPTFIYVGERDVECPAVQSVEFWHGLKAVGVKTRLLILEGEGHGIRRPEHVRQVANGEFDWFEANLAAK